MSEQDFGTALEAFEQRWEARFGRRIDKIEANQRAVIQRMDAQDLNGSADKLRQIARVAPKLLKLATLSDTLDALATHEQEGRVFARELRRRVRWDRGTKDAIKWGFGILAMIVAAIVSAHFFAAEPARVAPSVPVVTAPPTPSPIPHVEVTP